MVLLTPLHLRGNNNFYLNPFREKLVRMDRIWGEGGWFDEKWGVTTNMLKCRHLKEKI